ncbi:hypothetical protein RRG08_063518 [Elysia crispata]|uniref:Endonuclease/exonuclease/phosphatase domain-containing protein n=1 Tax=Elysia crispata TaxID=231223 RepID=A0AAE1E8R1_9GAST|nr:hypothetical protein RRG08_063518 [Elysia crispata]
MYLRHKRLCKKVTVAVLNINASFEHTGRHVSCCGVRSDGSESCANSPTMLSIEPVAMKPQVKVTYLDNVTIVQCTGVLNYSDSLIWVVASQVSVWKYMLAYQSLKLPVLYREGIAISKRTSLVLEGPAVMSQLNVTRRKQYEGLHIACLTQDRKILTADVLRIPHELTSEVVTLPTFEAERPQLLHKLNETRSSLTVELKCKAPVGTGSVLTWLFRFVNVSSIWGIRAVSETSGVTDELPEDVRFTPQSTRFSYRFDTGSIVDSFIAVNLTDVRAMGARALLACLSYNASENFQDLDITDELMAYVEFDFSEHTGWLGDVLLLAVVVIAAASCILLVLVIKKKKKKTHGWLGETRGAEATGRTPLTENQPRCFASRACKPRSYREAPPTKKPVNTSPGQRVDGRPKPASIMTVQQKGGRISQGLKGDPFRGDISATLSPTERRTPSHEVPQSKPHRGRCGADRGRGSTATLHIATYNTRTLALQDDLDHLQEKLEDFKWNVIGLCETKRKGEGLMELSDGTWIYDAGKTEESPETKGMAFLVRKNFKDYIEGFCKHSDRVISCKVKLQEGSLQIIQVYAPTTDYDDEEAEKFYEDLENAIEKKCANTVIMGDFNAKIGVKDEDEENEWIGPFGIGTRNERGEKLIDFCTANRLFMGRGPQARPGQALKVRRSRFTRSSCMDRLLHPNTQLFPSYTQTHNYSPVTPKDTTIPQLHPNTQLFPSYSQTHNYSPVTPKHTTIPHLHPNTQLFPSYSQTHNYSPVTPKHTTIPQLLPNTQLFPSYTQTHNYSPVTPKHTTIPQLLPNTQLFPSYSQTHNYSPITPKHTIIPQLLPNTQLFPSYTQTHNHSPVTPKHTTIPHLLPNPQLFPSYSQTHKYSPVTPKHTTIPSYSQTHNYSPVTPKHTIIPQLLPNTQLFPSYSQTHIYSPVTPKHTTIPQ